MFDSLPNREARPLALLRNGTLVLVGTLLLIGIVSTYRALVQVRHLELETSEGTLRSGSTVETEVVISGRTMVDVHLELIQGAHSETLGVLNVRGNEFGFLDPRPKQVSQKVTINNDILSRFHDGEARLRATAIGREQFTRLPPPVVRELRVEISKL
jgi:hypothetical protein